MNKIILVNAVWHGLLCCTDNVATAIDFLYNSEWLTAMSDCYKDSESEEVANVKTNFGENWKEVLKTKTSDELNDIFFEQFEFSEMDVLTGGK